MRTRNHNDAQEKQTGYKGGSAGEQITSCSLFRTAREGRPADLRGGAADSASIYHSFALIVTVCALGASSG